MAVWAIHIKMTDLFVAVAELSARRSPGKCSREVWGPPETHFCSGRTKRETGPPDYWRGADKRETLKARPPNCPEIRDREGESELEIAKLS